jgi:hypothetical protein
MPFFKVTIPTEEEPTYHQSHDRATLRYALKAQGYAIAKIEAVRACVDCHHAAAVRYNRLCVPCYDVAIARGRETYKDEPISDAEKDELTMSFYVDA